jgi:L-ascorbate metabolism protein UlaG (beta-lactamase superfamily)
MKAASFGKRAAGERLERMKASPRWKDGTFTNTFPVSQGLKKGSGPAIAEFLCGGQRRTPPAPLPSLDPRPGWAGPAETGLRATWLGHSTVLLEVDGLRVLTDPVWGERASPLSFAGPRRFQPVPVPVAALPPLDAVIVSHDHYDHLDYPTILELLPRDVPFITSLGVGAHLQAWGVPPERITELDWWESARLRGGDLRITAAPSQHFSGRGITGRNGTLWSSMAIQGPRHRVFFSGDTGLTAEYSDIAGKLGPFDLILLEVGAFHPAWGDIHLGPENALEALALLGGGSFLPVHWGTFNLAMHAWDDPAETLVRLAGREPASEPGYYNNRLSAPEKGVHLVMPRLGEPIEPARVERVTPWWRALAEAEQSKKRSKNDLKDAPEEAPTLPPEMGWPID